MASLRFLAKGFCLRGEVCVGWEKQKIFLKNDSVLDKEVEDGVPCADVDGSSSEVLFLLSCCMLSGRVLVTTR